VFQLKEAFRALGIHIVGYRRTSKPDSVLEYFPQGEAQPLQLDPGEATGGFSRPNSRVKETLVSVDVSHAGEKGLVEQGRLNGQLPSAKERGEFRRSNRKWLCSGALKSICAAEVAKLEAAKPSRIDEPQLASASEGQPCMCVSSQRGVGSGDQKPPRHSEMDDPLRGDFAGLRGGVRMDDGAGLSRTQFADNVFSGAMNSKNRTPRKALDLVRRFSFEGLTMPAEPDLRDPVATHTQVHAPGDRFNLRQFRHLLILDE